MEQENSNPNLQEYDTFSEFSREQGSAFKTSFLGFDKDDVISYIDRLVRDVTDQKNSLEDAHIRLTEQNRSLVDRINRYEQEMYTAKQELEDERQYNVNAREREELFKKAVGVLQEKVAYLQENSSTGQESNYKVQIEKANDIIVRLREELLSKDRSISKISDEVSRRNEILIDQDRLLTMKDKQLDYYTKSLESMKQKLYEQTLIANRMNEQINVMQTKISQLESRLLEASKQQLVENKRANSPYDVNPFTPGTYMPDNMIDTLNYRYYNQQQPREAERNQYTPNKQSNTDISDELLERLSSEYRRSQYPENNYPQPPIANQYQDPYSSYRRSNNVANVDGSTYADPRTQNTYGDSLPDLIREAQEYLRNNGSNTHS